MKCIDLIPLEWRIHEVERYGWIRKRRGGGCHLDMLCEEQKCEVAIRNNCNEGHERYETARGTLKFDLMTIKFTSGYEF